MTQQRNIPISLSVVSYLFLFMGIMSVVDIIGALIMGSLNFDFGILGLWIFFGLRRFSPSWRTCALVFIWLSMIGLVFGFIYGFVGHDPAFIKIFGKRYADIPVSWVSIIAVIFFPLEFWQYRVLTSPNIRILFYDHLQTPAA